MVEFIINADDDGLVQLTIATAVAEANHPNKLSTVLVERLHAVVVVIRHVQNTFIRVHTNAVGAEQKPRGGALRANIAHMASCNPVKHSDAVVICVCDVDLVRVVQTDANSIIQCTRGVSLYTFTDLSNVR